MNEKEQENQIANSIDEMNRSGKFQEAIEQADKAIDQFAPPGFGEGHCFSFDSMEQFIFFCAKMKSINKLDTAIYSACHEATILTSKAYALCELKRHEDAIQALNHALLYNPISTDIRFELVENYLQLRQYDQVARIMKELETLVIYPKEIAKYYRRYGYLLTEEGKFKPALACYMFSLHLEPSDLAVSEVGYILQECLKVPVPEGKAMIASMKGDGAVRILVKNNVFLQINDERLTLLSGGSAESGKNYFEEYCALGIVKKTQICS